MLARKGFLGLLGASAILPALPASAGSSQIVNPPPADVLWNPCREVTLPVSDAYRVLLVGAPGSPDLIEIPSISIAKRDFQAVFDHAPDITRRAHVRLFVLNRLNVDLHARTLLAHPQQILDRFELVDETGWVVFQAPMSLRVTPRGWTPHQKWGFTGAQRRVATTVTLDHRVLARTIHEIEYT